MPDRYVVDAGVVSLYFAGNRRAKQYLDEVFQRKATGHICEVNVAEFQYNCARAFGAEVAEIRVRSIRNSALRVEGIDDRLSTEAARLKVSHWAFSLADCYLIALAKRIAGTILTTDGPVSKSGEAPAILIQIPKN